MTNEYDLNSIRNQVESMNEFHQYEILKILNTHENVALNENKYGVFVNLTDLSDGIIQELTNYIIYHNKQEKELSGHENTLQQYHKDFFSNEKNISMNMTNGSFQ
jgi:hypothetical protein